MEFSSHPYVRSWPKAVDSFRMPAEQKGAPLLPGSGRLGPDIQADGNRIAPWVLTNLMANALHYPSGGAVRLTAGAFGPFAKFQSAITGPGSLMNIQSKIFDKICAVKSHHILAGADWDWPFAGEIVRAHGGNDLG